MLISQPGPWTYAMLPYLEQSAMWNLGTAGANPAGCVNSGTIVKAFLSPGRGRTAYLDSNKYQATDYALNTYAYDGNNTTNSAGTWWNPGKKNLTLVSITDGTSNTIFVGEKSVSSNLYTPSTFIGNWDDPAFQVDGGNCRMGLTIQRDGPNFPNNGGPFWGSPYSSALPLACTTAASA